MALVGGWDDGKPRFKSDLVPQVVERDTRKKAKEQALHEAYEVVNKRDAGKCRVTGVSLVAGAADPKIRREHHHLAKRSTHRQQRADPKNIILVSAFAHELIERGWIVVEGRRADRDLFFHWSALATSRPLKITRWNPREKA